MFERLLIPLAGLLMVYLICILIVLINAEAQCLAKGYPEAKITYDFATYCITLNGDVTVAVENTNEVE